MKTTNSIKGVTLIALLGAALALPVWAQGGNGMGGMGGMGGGQGMQNGGQCGVRGMAPCARGGGRGMAYNQDNMRGWELMTADERTQFQKQMRAVTTYDECVAVQTDHRGAMEVRAKEKGVTLQAPRRNACDNLKARGIIE